MKDQTRAMLASYLRAALVAVLTLVGSGNLNLRDLVIGAAAALVGPLARAANPYDSSYGRGAE
jgi:hypothetical protein